MKENKEDSPAQKTQVRHDSTTQSPVPMILFFHYYTEDPVDFFVPHEPTARFQPSPLSL